MENEKVISAQALLLSIRDDPEINGKNFALVKKHINAAFPNDPVHAAGVCYCSECIREWCPVKAHLIMTYHVEKPFCAAGKRSAADA